WLFGKFLSYLIVCSCLVGASIFTLSLTVLPIEDAEFSRVPLLTLLRYEGVVVMSLLGYGAVAALLGAQFRHPVIIGALLFFGWKRIVRLTPVVTDLLPNETYLTPSLPMGGGGVVNLVGGAANDLLELKVDVSPLTAMLVLVSVAAGCLALASHTVR